MHLGKKSNEKKKMKSKIQFDIKIEKKKKLRRTSELRAYVRDKGAGAR